MITTQNPHTKTNKPVSVNHTLINRLSERTLLTDLYQLTMLAGYHDAKIREEEATFDLFVRKIPKDWGYLIANGIEDAIDYATHLKFTEDDISYLREQGLFKEQFLTYLKDFRFTGDIHAVLEGTPVFANEPILRVTARRSEAQFLETLLLNTINFQTMIASKASRVVNAAGDAKVVDFGLRRAQEADAGMTGARAAYIAGAAGTSNVLAGKEYGIPIAGTMAHSFVMSFPKEIDSFRSYVSTFPDKATLLIDTYDTVQGAKNAVIVAKKLEENGHRLRAVRLDSGDLCTLSTQVRNILDIAGFGYVKILASNDLNEYKIAELRKNGARIDGYGVGTEMITAKPEAAISGVYKLVEDTSGAKIKLSSGKKTYPGRKQVYRVFSGETYDHDVLALEDEHIAGAPLLEAIVRDGERVVERRPLEEIRNYSLRSVARLPERVKELSAGQYALDISPKLSKLANTLTEHYGGA
ncbi:MAG: nicotinate phosphoribosyltransferase [Nanoarchaeota archaeon]